MLWDARQGDVVWGRDGKRVRESVGSIFSFSIVHNRIPLASTNLPHRHSSGLHSDHQCTSSRLPPTIIVPRITRGLFLIMHTAPNSGEHDFHVRCAAFHIVWASFLSPLMCPSHTSLIDVRCDHEDLLANSLCLACA